MPTICPRCYKAIGQTPWCGLCRAHNDATQPCGCLDCDPDTHNDDAAIAAYEARLAEQEAAHIASLPAPDDAWTAGPSPYWSTAAGDDNPF